MQMQSGVNMHVRAHAHTQTHFEQAAVVTPGPGWGVEFPTIPVVFTEECAASPGGKMLSCVCGCVDGIIPSSL